MRSRLIILFTAAAVSFAAFAQNDKGVIKEYKNEFYRQIQESLDKFYHTEREPRETLKMDFSGYDLPESKDEFKTHWHKPPVSQGLTGTCWDFSTTSMIESEVYRLYEKEVKLSEMFTAYWEFVEKARNFVENRGDALFAHGSQGDAVFDIWKKYGIVPREVYDGLKPGQEYFDHGPMFREMYSYLLSVKEDNAWNEEEVVETIKDILNHYMGSPPESFNYDGKTYTPKEFLEEGIKINPDDYVAFISIMNQPYYEKGTYDVPDNWRKSYEYYNVPLDDFTAAIDGAVKDGFTVCIGGDVSEPGIDGYTEVAMVPSFDIPADYIDESSRFFRFYNESSTDDHLIHMVGYEEGGDWYLIKDSGSHAFNGKNKGYIFYHKDYVKLKILAFWVHKDAVQDYIDKF